MNSNNCILNRTGFSLIELMVAIAVIGILSTIAIPNIISWREGTKIRNVSRSLATDLQYGKNIAVRENTDTVFVATGNDYTICLNDSGAGDCSDSGDDVLRSRTMPAGLFMTNDLTDNTIRFDGSGVAWFTPDTSPVDEEATITINTSGGNTTEINVNFLARVRVTD